MISGLQALIKGLVKIPEEDTKLNQKEEVHEDNLSHQQHVKYYI